MHLSGAPCSLDLFLRRSGCYCRIISPNVLSLSLSLTLSLALSLSRFLALSLSLTCVYMSALRNDTEVATVSYTTGRISVL